MNTRFGIGIGLLGILASACTQATTEDFDELEASRSQAETTVTSTTDYVGLPGQGYNTVTEQWRAQCVTGPTKQSGGNGAGKITYDALETQEQIEQSLSASVSAKGTIKLFSAELKSSFTKHTITTGRTINMVYKADAVTGMEILDQSGLNWTVAKDAPDFTPRCGDGFVSQIVKGGEIYILVQVEFASKAEKTAFESSLEGSFAKIVSGKLTFAAALESFKGRVKVHMEAFQVGGNPGRLGSVLIGKNGVLPAVDCEPGNFKACQDYMSNAIIYAANEFGNDLEANPANLDYVVEDWSLLGLNSAQPEVSASVKEARKLLGEKLRLQARVQNRYEAMARTNNFYGANSDIIDGCRKSVEKSNKNLDVLKPAVTACYDDLAKPAIGEPGCTWVYIAGRRRCVPNVSMSREQICVREASLLRLEANGYVELTDELEAMEVRLGTGCSPDSNCARDDWHSNVTPGLGHWGTFSAWDMCPAGQYAIGYEMRVEPHRGGNFDDTALNAIRITCADMDRKSSHIVQPHPGKWGFWMGESRCTHGAMVGMSIDVESRQGNGDDTGANNVAALCASGQPLQAPGGAPYADKPEEIGAMTTCPPGTAICGARVRFEEYQGSGDDTAMNGLQLACCAY